MVNLGLGLMRLPLLSENLKDVDFDTVNKMIDKIIDSGFNYFDSGLCYHDGVADKVIKDCLLSRYPREDVLIANKLPLYEFKGEENLEAIFNKQLEACGVSYFDYYLVHNVNDGFEDVCNKLDCFGFVLNKKNTGKAKKIGFSFHDTAEVLDKYLNKYPDFDFVLLQINYLDWENESIQSKKCYEIARSHGVEIMIMEPIKGGTLAQVPNDVENKFKQYNSEASIASWALRFCASLDGVSTILSGSSDLEQLEDNINTIHNFNPLNNDEIAIINEARDLINSSIEIKCSYCNYCIPACPNNILISNFFSLYNDAKSAIEIQDIYYIYYNNFAKKGSKASQCNNCGECISRCPQHLDIPIELEKIVDLLENDKFSY